MVILPRNYTGLLRPSTVKQLQPKVTLDRLFRVHGSSCKGGQPVFGDDCGSVEKVVVTEGCELEATSRTSFAHGLPGPTLSKISYVLWRGEEGGCFSYRCEVLIVWILSSCRVLF